MGEDSPRKEEKGAHHLLDVERRGRRRWALRRERREESLAGRGEVEGIGTDLFRPSPSLLAAGGTADTSP